MLGFRLCIRLKCAWTLHFCRSYERKNTFCETLRLTCFYHGNLLLSTGKGCFPFILYPRGRRASRRLRLATCKNLKSRAEWAALSAILWPYDVFGGRHLFCTLESVLWLATLESATGRGRAERAERAASEHCQLSTHHSLLLFIWTAPTLRF